jgi:hypothetical protein
MVEDRMGGGEKVERKGGKIGVEGMSRQILEFSGDYTNINININITNNITVNITININITVNINVNITVNIHNKN